MKKRGSVVVGLAIVVMSLAAGPVLALPGAHIDPVMALDPDMAYGAMIDDYIRACKGKCCLLTSSSPHIQKLALRALLKRAFMEANRAELIAYLKAHGVGYNPNRVRHHLNERFFEAFAGSALMPLVKLERQMF